VDHPWTEIAPPERIALLHGESRGDPNAFESVLTFEPDSAATRIEMRCSRPRISATRRSRSTTRSRAASRPGATWLQTSSRSFGRERRADGREGVLQRVDVAGRVHRARVPRGLDGQQWMELQQWIFDRIRSGAVSYSLAPRSARVIWSWLGSTTRQISVGLLSVQPSLSGVTKLKSSRDSSILSPT